MGGMCSNDAGSCERHLCECDAMFAEKHKEKAHYFDADYHIFWTTRPEGWNPKDSCRRNGGGGPYEPQCCVTETGPAVLYNAETHICKPDGDVSLKDQPKKEDKNRGRLLQKFT